MLYKFSATTLKSVAATVIAGLCLSCFSGCSNQSSAKSDSPYDAVFEQERQSVDDPELLAMLQDNYISDEEFAQSQQMEVACYAQQGLKATPHENRDGGMLVEDTPNLPSDQFEKIVDECSSRYSFIGMLYWEPRNNPEAKSNDEFILECLKKFKVVEQGMSLEQFETAVDNNPLAPANPPWDITNGDAYGCETEMQNYKGGHPDLDPDEALERTKQQSQGLLVKNK